MNIIKKKRKVAVIAGSDSDLLQIAQGINLLRIGKKRGLIDVHFIDTCSAHRNPLDLERLVEDCINSGVDVIITCAGKLAALFGVVDLTLLRNKYHNTSISVVAVPMKGDTQEATDAAILSAKQVPGSQFVYQGEFANDHTKAFEFAISGELPEIKLALPKPSVRRTIEQAYEFTRMKFPAGASYDAFIQRMEEFDLFHMYTGKTRETFQNFDFPELLFIYATDRISIFDIVMNTQIAQKGAVLTAATVRWLKGEFSDIPNHLVAWGSGILEYIPEKMRQGLNREELIHLMHNMIVVRKTKVFKVEAIIRGNLTGSGYKDYLKTGSVCGIQLPAGLVDGSELPEPIFTPSTKADYGQHDENISFEKMVEQIGAESANYIKEKSLEIFIRARKLAREAGIIIADTKLEFGVDLVTGEILLIDETFTPDSSRFWLEEEWLQALVEKITPPSLDKQPVRIEGEKAGIKTSNPDWIPGAALCEQTRQNYLRIISLLSHGLSLEQFQLKDMRVWKSE
jgi:phosphoribosylaminoimidazole-succinocarboxamide synthase